VGAVAGGVPVAEIGGATDTLNAVFAHAPRIEQTRALPRCSPSETLAGDAEFDAVAFWAPPSGPHAVPLAGSSWNEADRSTPSITIKKLRASMASSGSPAT
jgi:hypothetical protein